MFRPLPLSIAFCLLFLFLFFPSKATLQPRCEIPGFPHVTDPKTMAWQKNAQVQVNADPRFSPEERQAIQTALSNWNSSNGPTGNCSGVVFTLPPTYNATPISGQNKERQGKGSLNTWPPANSRDLLAVFDLPVNN